MVAVKRNEDIKILMKENTKMTRNELFEKKELFHKQLAKIPFEQKIRMVVCLQEIAHSIRTSSKKNQKPWKISSLSSDKGI